MINIELVKKLIDSDFLSTTYQHSDHEIIAALPDASLGFLLKICSTLNVKNVFEFGSGRSTKAFLNNGYLVTSLEDSSYWLAQTKANLHNHETVNHSCMVKALSIKFLGMFPVMDWFIDKKIAGKLIEADLILVDSPYYTPFRESTLWSSLKNSKGAVIVIDDTRIHTLKRFCDRLSNSNDTLIHARVNVGHGFDIFYSKDGKNLRLNHSVIDILKGWNRFFQGVLFYSKLRRNKSNA